MHHVRTFVCQRNQMEETIAAAKGKTKTVNASVIVHVLLLLPEYCNYFANII